MSNIEEHPGDLLIAEYARLQQAIRDTEFPILVQETVTDDGETWEALRCPRCDGIISNAGDLIAVSPAEDWAYSDDIGDHEIDHQTVEFEAGRPDLDETIYYLHDAGDGHAVSLPEGWTEKWM